MFGRTERTETSEDTGLTIHRIRIKTITEDEALITLRDRRKRKRSWKETKMKSGFSICSPYAPECLIKIFKFSLYNHHTNCYEEWLKSKNTAVMVPSESESCFVMSNSLGSHGLYSPGILQASCSLLQGIFPIQGLNRGLLHCRQILYQLSYQGISLELILYLVVCT